MDLRVVHPIPLTVADIVGDLHVSMLFAAASATVPRAQPVVPRLPADHQSRSDIETTLKSNRAADVRSVPCAAGMLDVETDRLQFNRKCLHVRGTQMGVLGGACDCHQFCQPSVFGYAATSRGGR